MCYIAMQFFIEHFFHMFEMLAIILKNLFWIVYLGFEAVSLYH